MPQGDEVAPAAVPSPRDELGFASASAPPGRWREVESPAEPWVMSSTRGCDPPDHSWGGQGTK